jgi:Ca2+-dependent lipid-binding protein
VKFPVQLCSPNDTKNLLCLQVVVADISDELKTMYSFNMDHYLLLSRHHYPFHLFLHGTWFSYVDSTLAMAFHGFEKKERNL